MALLNIVQEGDPILTKVCRPVKEITPRIVRLIDDMKETLIDADGAGLAAPQVGIMRRVVVLYIGDELVELINPEIIASEGEQQEIEGCLSVPGVWGITDRPEKVTVRGLDRNGDVIVREGEGLSARCICHELDHLDGHLFTEKAVRILTEKELEEYMESKKNAEE